MTTTVQTISANGNLSTRTATQNILPGEQLTNGQLRDLLTQRATTDGNVSAATAGNGDTAASDVVTTDPGGSVQYTTGFSDWIANNPGMAAGGALLIGWILYQAFKSKRKR